MTPADDLPRFIPLISDYGFKATFGNETKTLFLRRALQALIESPVPIERVTFEKNTLDGFTADSRGGIYDLLCTDERNNQFIVEMQLGEYPAFLHRMKFYALYKYNTLVKKGDYHFDGLFRIYCIGILNNVTFPGLSGYHNVATLRNADGQQMDDQLTFITVELAKFTKPLAEIHSDLDKLLYTMKTLHNIEDRLQKPEFWTEEWLKEAIEELDRRSMTADERMAYEMAFARNATVFYQHKHELEQEVKHEVANTKAGIVRNMLERGGFSTEQIAELVDMPVEFVLNVQQQHQAGKQKPGQD